MAHQLSSNGSREPEMVKLYLAEGESGWAEVIGPGRARIENIPFSGKYNIDDVVKITRGARPKIVGLVFRRYDTRAVVWYDEESQFHKMAEMVRVRGGKVEGLFCPSAARRGAMAVAMSSESGDPFEVAKEAGVENPEGR